MLENFQYSVLWAKLQPFHEDRFEKRNILYISVFSFSNFCHKIFWPIDGVIFKVENPQKSLASLLLLNYYIGENGENKNLSLIEQIVMAKTPQGIDLKWFLTQSISRKSSELPQNHTKSSYSRYSTTTK